MDFTNLLVGISKPFVSNFEEDLKAMFLPLVLHLNVSILKFSLVSSLLLQF